jgi:hypothetical protein
MPLKVTALEVRQLAPQLMELQAVKQRLLQNPPPPSPASHQPSHVVRVKVSRLFLFAATREPARCASSALAQQNISAIIRAHSSC